MSTFKKSMFAAAIFPMGIYGSGVALGADVKVMLTGANEVPPVTTSASGDSAISIADDGTVSGSVTTKGVQGTAAHIHMGATGKNGPVVVPFTKEGDIYKAPAGAKLNADQLKPGAVGDVPAKEHPHEERLDRVDRGLQFWRLRVTPRGDVWGEVVRIRVHVADFWRPSDFRLLVACFDFV